MNTNIKNVAGFSTSSSSPLIYTASCSLSGSTWTINNQTPNNWLSAIQYNDVGTYTVRLTSALPINPVIQITPYWISNFVNTLGCTLCNYSNLSDLFFNLNIIDGGNTEIDPTGLSICFIATQV